MLDRVRGLSGEALDRAAYHARRRAETQRPSGPIRKLERSQYFREPDDDPSWGAFLAGDWVGAIAAFEDDRDSARAEVEAYARHGGELRRLRVVEDPPSSYLQWEMWWFKILAEEGTKIRTLAAELVAGWELKGPLPELVVDEHALYQVRYDEAWAACGACRIDDPEVLRSVTEHFDKLWERAEPFTDYFSREIVPLPPPLVYRRP